MEFTNERLKPEDAQELLEYFRQIGGESEYLSFGSEGLPFTVEQEQQYIRENLNSDRNAIFVTKKDGKIIGDCSFFSLSRRFSHRGDISIAVLKDYWHCGVGSALLRTIISFAKECANAEIISLEVRCDNTRAIALYKKFGFEKIGYYKNFFKIGEHYYDADLMNLYL